MTSAPLMESNIPGREPDARGKVRDLYDLGDRMLIVATDRISAFDWINPVGIPDKGVILTQIALYWFDYIDGLAEHHLISTEVADFPEPFCGHAEQLSGRSMLVRKCEMLPIEFVIRGYLAGSGWKEYRESGTICGIQLPDGLTESAELPEPIYTPATKSHDGHDINIPPEEVGAIIGDELNEQAAALSYEIYAKGRERAAECGMILCDTKFEFGLLDGKLVLCDEILTPDSSRYWPALTYTAGAPQPSYDKQFVRDYLETTDWDKNSPQPALPDEIVEKTRKRYLEAYARLTGRRDL